MNNPKPKIYNNDIKVLGRVVSITSENKVAAAEQIFDEKFKYNELPDYSFDNENIDPTRKGLNQYSINRLIGKKVKDIEDAGLLPDEDGFLNNIKIDNLTVKNGATFSGDVSFGDNVSIDKNLTVGNKITTKDLEVTNNARINNLIVGPGEGIDVYDALTHLLLCCENMNNQGGSGQGGITLVVSPNPINMNVGDTVEFTVKLNVGGMDLVIDPEINYTASISNTSVATLIGNNKVKAVSGGTTQLTVSWNGIQKTVQINVTQPLLTFRVTFYPNNGQDNFYQDVQEGNKLVAVTNPTKTGYTFNGWHKDTESGTVWNFNDAVTSNMSLVAGYTLNEPEQSETHTYQLTLDPTSMNMTVGEETRGIIATRKRDNDVVISDGTINWTSNNMSVATVDWAGTVTVHGQGDATITATWVDPNGETKTATCSVTASVNIVQPTSLKIVGHENVTVDESTKVATVDVTDGSKTVKFKAVITPSNADTDTEITWTKLDGVGEITPDPNDSSICTYTSLDRSSICNLKASTANGISDQILINVVAQEQPVTHNYNITVNPQSLPLTVGQSTGNVITATCTDGATAVNNPSITWSSSNTAVATVSDGTVTPLSAGTTIITATWNGDSDTCEVTVSAAVEPETHVYGFSVSPASLSLTAGGSPGTITAIPTDNGTAMTGQTITWATSNSSAATVSNGTVTPEGEGSATITASWYDPDGTSHSDTCSVTVSAAPVVHDYNISVNPTSQTITSGGEGFTITATTKDGNTDMTNQTVTWTSSNTNAATVTSGGVVSPVDNLVDNASTTITATWASPDGNKTATCTVTVNKKPATMTAQDITLRVGETNWLGMYKVGEDGEVHPTGITISDGSWPTSMTCTITDESVATATTELLDSVGEYYWRANLTGVSRGTTTATLSATTPTGTYTCTFDITVLNLFENVSANGTKTVDIFGNDDWWDVNNGTVNNTAALPQATPNGDFDTRVETITLSIPTQSLKEYISENMLVSEDWLTARIGERSNGSQLLIINADPWTDKIDELKSSVEYKENIGNGETPVIDGFFGGNDVYDTSSTSRSATITLTAPDGSTLTVPVKQLCVYGAKTTSGSATNVSLDATSMNIWSSIDWYGPAGETFSAGTNQNEYFRNLELTRTNSTGTFAVLHPAASVQGITGLPSVMVADRSTANVEYDSSYVILHTTTIQ